MVVFFLVVGGLIGAGLWLWMAWANKRGRSWARIVSTVFFAIATLGLIGSFAQANTIASRIITIVGWAIGLAALVFLWQRQSSDYYAAVSRPPATHRLRMGSRNTVSPSMGSPNMGSSTAGS